MLGSSEYEMIHGDCIERMSELPEKSIDFSVFSPPFPSLFSYTSLESDIGNSEDLHGESKIHLSCFFRQLIRVMKPGRIIILHCTQIPGLLRNGIKGTFDFRGMLIRLGQRAGLTYQYDWLVRKNPQAQAIRTHSHKLLFVTLERDRAVSCGAFGDYLIKYIAPGDNDTPINSSEISREQWIDWAEACWTDIKETDTLNIQGTKGPDDVRHICPLQLGVIDRLVKLYSNPGELVLSPFAGIGSEGFVALKNYRKFLGIELKPEYYRKAIENCERAIKLRGIEQMGLFAEGLKEEHTHGSEEFSYGKVSDSEKEEKLKELKSDIAGDEKYIGKLKRKLKEVEETKEDRSKKMEELLSRPAELDW